MSLLQVHTFYEAVGMMINAQNDQVAQEHLIERYMLLPNQVWDGIINQATQNVEVLKDAEAVKQLGNILKTNVRACKALGHPYVAQVMYKKEIENSFVWSAYLLTNNGVFRTCRQELNLNIIGVNNLAPILRAGFSMS